MIPIQSFFVCPAFVENCVSDTCKQMDIQPLSTEKSAKNAVIHRVIHIIHRHFIHISTENAKAHENYVA